MAWSDFTAGLFTSGQILTAAQMNTYVRDNLYAGGPIYTTLAALQAAIPSPFEGQRAYLTSPAATTVTATGTTQVIPGGVTVVYNGSAWVCTTEVGAMSSTSGTTTSGTYVTTLTGDGTALSVSAITGTTAYLSMFARFAVSTASTPNIAVSVSGATTISAASTPYDVILGQLNAGVATPMGFVYPVSGLTAGLNTFTLNYLTNAGTVTFAKRSLTVKGIA